MKILTAAGAAILLLAGVAYAQKPKSAGERDALMKVQQATTPADQIKAIDDVLTRFADTEFKPLLLSMAADAASRMGDYEKTVIYGERAVEANPKNPDALYTLSAAIVQHTREHDLDKDDKLKRVDKLANDGIAAAKDLPNPQPAQITAAQWDQDKKDKTAAFYNVLGMSADLKKNYPDAITDFKTALGLLSKPDAVILARLSKTYNNAGQYDDALATADKVLSDASVSAGVKQFATIEKTRATKAKAEAGTGAK